MAESSGYGTRDGPNGRPYRTAGPNGRSRLDIGIRREEEPSIGDLLRSLTADLQHLVRAELALAKAEVRDTGATLARDAKRMGIAAAFGIMGLVALTAFLVVGLGELLGDNYWLSALIVTVVMLAIAGLLARSAARDMSRRGVAPALTMETVREDGAWASQQVKQLKRDMTTREPAALRGPAR